MTIYIGDNHLVHDDTTQLAEQALHLLGRLA